MNASHEPRDIFGAKLGMWLFLFTELILFGGLFLLYSVYLARYPHEFAAGGKQLNVVYGTINTGILLTSSLWAAMALTAGQRKQHRQAVGLLLATLACAAGFMTIKYLEWSAKFAHGIYPGSAHLQTMPPGEQIFFALYYLSTGLHGLHVLIGAGLLAWLAAQLKNGTSRHEDHLFLENGVLYWHLVDLIWIFIFPLYYLIL